MIDANWLKLTHGYICTRARSLSHACNILAYQICNPLKFNRQLFRMIKNIFIPHWIYLYKRFTLWPLLMLMCTFIVLLSSSSFWRCFTNNATDKQGRSWSMIHSFANCDAQTGENTMMVRIKHGIPLRISILLTICICSSANHGRVLALWHPT